MIIPIDSGIAFQSFNVQLGQYKVKFKVSWVTRFGYFSVDMTDITEADEIVITTGAVLNLGVNIIGDILDAEKYGTMIVIGTEEATIDNIGTTAGLDWTAA